MRLLPRRALARSVLVAAAACAVAAPAYAASSAASPAAAPAVSSAAGTSGAAAASRSCGRAFTTSAKTHASTRTKPLVDVRAGRHACYDRLVLEFRGPVNGYTIKYVRQVHAEGSGKPVPLAGHAKLQVTVVAPAYDSKGRPTYTPADPKHVVDVRGYVSFRQVAWAGSFEGYTTLGVGVRGTLPFRVSVLRGPGTHSRIVLDVAHYR